MSRSTFKLLSLLMAIGYAWALMASAGSVICIGTDGHLAMEPVAGKHCQEWLSPLAAAQDSDRDGLPSLTVRACVDTPTASHHEKATRGNTIKRTQPRSGTVCPDTMGFWAFSPVIPLLLPGPSCLQASSVHPHPTVALLRTVVLRL